MLNAMGPANATPLDEGIVQLRQSDTSLQQRIIGAVKRAF